jgi:hypothetical protein
MNQLCESRKDGEFPELVPFERSMIDKFMRDEVGFE